MKTTQPKPYRMEIYRRDKWWTLTVYFVHTADKSYAFSTFNQLLKFIAKQK